MKNFFTLKRHASSGIRGIYHSRMAAVPLLPAACLLVAAVAGFNPQITDAQRLNVPVKVSSLTSQASATGTLITIAADNTLGRAQTWQDDEGYHVVLPNTVAAASLKIARGVKVRSVGSSLEILLQTKPGAKVGVQTALNQLNLAIDGKLVARSTDSFFRIESTSPEERRLFEDPQYVTGPLETTPSLRLSSTVEDLTFNSREAGSDTSHSAATQTPAAVSQAPTQVSSNQIVPQGDGTTAPEPPSSVIRVGEPEESVLSSIFSGTSVLIVFVVGLFALLVSRKLRSRQEVAATPTSNSEDKGDDEREALEGNAQASSAGTVQLVRAGESGITNGSSRQSVVRTPVAGPASLYGAYRIDQEVGKLILGQPHRIDVLASRAIDDRRAVETSLIKGVNSTEFDESSRRRAREALEEYGFVARQCAALLLAPDAFDRSSAARSLGEIKSEAALPFLLESLYDSESIVRNQAVVSIGELKLPSAIGALLDIARTHPDVPSALLSRTLSACSVEGLDFFDAVVSEPALLGVGDVGNIVDEITHLEPASSVENLPESSDDEQLTQALLALNSIEVDERSEALKTLVQFRVQSAVDAIAQVARHDFEPGIRSQAIACLGSIDHESVFTTVLSGMADEAREVRAAAARSLNRLSFDRADAYVRVIHTGDEETIRNVAKACIQSGIVSQNLDRLTDSDHRQAYETFSLICLLSEARMNEPVLNAISSHPRNDVRLKVVHLLACTGHPDTFNQLRELAVTDGVSEAVKTVLLEAMYKLDQAKTLPEETVEGPFILKSEPQDVREGSFVVNSESEQTVEGTFFVNSERLESHEQSLDDEVQFEALRPQQPDFKFEPVAESQDQTETDNREL